MPLKPRKLRINRGRNIWHIFGLVLAITSFNVSLTANAGKGYIAIVYQRKEEATEILAPHLKQNPFEE